MGCKCNAPCPSELTLNGGKKVRTRQMVLIYGSRTTFDIHFRRCGQLKKQPANRPILTIAQCSPPVCVCVYVLETVCVLEPACVTFRNVFGALSVKFASDVSDSPNTYNK